MGTRKKVHKKVKRPRYLHHAGEVIDMAGPRKKAKPRKVPVIKLTHEERREMEREERRFKYEQQELYTVGVRFPSDPSKEYTYLIRRNDVRPVFLGMEVVVRNSSGISRVAYITRIDPIVVMPIDYDGDLKEITRYVTDM